MIGKTFGEKHSEGEMEMTEDRKGMIRRNGSEEQEKGTGLQQAFPHLSLSFSFFKTSSIINHVWKRF